MNVYAIGGLGVDQRVFSELKLDFEYIPLDWIPALKNESLPAYADRFSEQIDNAQPFILIGVSFGGMLALELSKLLSPEKIILISSATSKSEIPYLFRFFGNLGLIKWTPNFLLKPIPFIANLAFGVKQKKHKRLLKEIMKDTDTAYLRWATHKITSWNHINTAINLSRIHGANDHLLGLSPQENIEIIPNAGHFMVVTHAKEVSHFLNRVVTNLKKRGNPKKRWT